eukprot:CAMPEP_0170491798 /NCGR_PEP_ID=MMETSP0208-20121228/11260_1 /TAXON_ID=197538 /ORGANISM="Strombidium inclinatum, Strain S3" /LENGTH=66 /DNA_ID=CAMNT_0010767431 /DNA_START=507 /DNA_END=707 /DNA_ORIENTATION=+
MDLLTKEIVRFDPVANDYSGLFERELTSIEDVQEVCSTLIRERGIAATAMNAHSSRFDCFINLNLY